MKKEGSTPAVEVPKYLHPKILLLDLDFRIAKCLREKGYNVSQGSLGTPYRVAESGHLFPIQGEYNLPFDYKEHEIVIIDLHYQTPLPQVELIQVESRVDTWWVGHNYGYVNPRALRASLIQSDFNRILDSGGVFIVFANRFEIQKFFWGHTIGYGFQTKLEREVSNYGFLRLTEDLQMDNDHGSMITVSKELPQGATIADFLSKYLRKATYDCTVKPGPATKGLWVSLAENKFGNSVAGALEVDEGKRGFVFVFPDIEDKADFLTEFVHQILPGLAPKLYPDLEKAGWANRPEYELATVQVLRNQIVEIREKAHTEIAGLEQSIQEQKDKYAYLFELITGTGDALVMAVEKTLRVLGFTKVVNMDKQQSEQGSEGQRREDLQVLDSTTSLLIEVKGISNYPSDDDALTIQKYIVLRMRQWGRVTVQGVSIVNLQRHLPPLDRDNDMPFRQEILDAAEEQSIGLMTTWDLHRLTRSYLHFRWRHETVRDLFYQKGRILPIPVHYEYLGCITHYYERISVIAVKIEGGSLTRGEKIAFELPVMFEEQACESLRVDTKDVEKADQGMLVTIKTHVTKQQARIGTRVYRVSNPEGALG